MGHEYEKVDVGLQHRYIIYSLPNTLKNFFFDLPHPPIGHRADPTSVVSGNETSLQS